MALALAATLLTLFFPAIYALEWKPWFRLTVMMIVVVMTAMAMASVMHALFA